MLNAFALLVIIILIATAIVIAVKLGALPGHIARRRTHPQADAITACGWLGLLTLGILWPIALIWAYSKPIDVAVRSEPDDGSSTEMTARIASLEAEVRRLRAAAEGGPT